MTAHSIWELTYAFVPVRHIGRMAYLGTLEVWGHA